jgi:hypothetical protein
MNFGYGTRVAAAVTLIACLGLVSSAVLLRQTRRNLRDQGRGEDPVAVLGRRLEPVRRDLPPGEIVGYVADPFSPSDHAAYVKHASEFIMTQYHLAPTIVLESTRYPLVIGNFHHEVPAARVTGMHLVLLKDFGDGVMLFRGAQ